MVLDNLETGSRDQSLDQGQKRFLSSTGARLLRLWRAGSARGPPKEWLKVLVRSKRYCLLQEISHIGGLGLDDR